MIRGICWNGYCWKCCYWVYRGGCHVGETFTVMRRYTKRFRLTRVLSMHMYHG